MKLPSTTLPPLTSSEIASKPKRLMTRPRTIELPPLMTRPVAGSPLPFSSTFARARLRGAVDDHRLLDEVERRTAA